MLCHSREGRNLIASDGRTSHKSKLFFLVPAEKVRIPNPTRGVVYLASKVNISDATVDIFDMIGTKHGSSNVKIGDGSPAAIILPRASGIYTLVVRSPMCDQALRVVEER